MICRGVVERCWRRARREGRKWPPAGTVAGDWAEMRVLQWFHGVCPQKLKNGRFVRFLKLENR